MVARETWITALEAGGSLGFLAVAYVVGSVTLWLGWAVATAILAGLTLVRLNWGFDPPPVS